MAVEGDLIYRTREQIVAQLIASWQTRVPDAWVEEDGLTRLIFETLAGEVEGVYLANQLLRDNIFIQTASLVELRRHGEQFGLAVKQGLYATGQLKFTGVGGTTINIGLRVGADPGTGETLYYQVTQLDTIPNPGIPAAPNVAEVVRPSVAPNDVVNVAGGNLNGTYRYIYTFVDANGFESYISPTSDGAAPVNQQIDLTAIAVGPAGTTARKIYRDKAASGTFRLVTTINDNVTTTFTDNVTDATVNGNPLAPTSALPAPGTYEYRVTFLTPEGETLPGITSAAVATISTATFTVMALTALPIGGPDTTGRKIYRQRDGGGFKLIATISNNTTLIYRDILVDGTAAPPLMDTAHAITVAGQAERVGTIYNAVAGAIDTLVDAPDGVASVTNPANFVGGADEEDMEAYRLRLLEYIRNPQSGSKSDLESWAESIDGVDKATAFPNDNLGVAQAGHVTIRIVGPNGAIPAQSVIDAVQLLIETEDLASIAIHVTTFTAVPTNVTVTITLATGYTLADVTPAVQELITDYINSIDVGGTLYLAGLYDAIFGNVPGVVTLVVNTPATDLTSTNTQKRTPGTLTVN
jgi:uncharacterized phage protein gp47/JayE